MGSRNVRSTKSVTPSGDFATILAAELIARGWSGKRYAAELGLSQSLVARYLRGESEPSLSRVLELLRPFGKGLAWLEEQGITAAK